MFGIGGSELLLILVLALIIFGPDKLPGIARSLGRTVSEFKKAANDFTRSLEQEGSNQERSKETQKEAQKEQETSREESQQARGNAADTAPE